MIVNDGKLLLLAQQLAYLSGGMRLVGLFVSNITILDGTVLADVVAVEATFAGYGRENVGTFGAAGLIGNMAASPAGLVASFTNSSGAPVVVFGWFFVDTTAGKLIAAVNFGPTTIPDGGILPITLVVTDNDVGG